MKTYIYIIIILVLVAFLGVFVDIRLTSHESTNKPYPDNEEAFSRNISTQSKNDPTIDCQCNHNENHVPSFHETALYNEIEFAGISSPTSSLFFYINNVVMGDEKTEVRELNGDLVNMIYIPKTDSYKYRFLDKTTSKAP